MKAVVAYIPVLHEGYRRFLRAHPRPVHLIGPELYTDYRPLAKDIRALSAEEVAPALAAWGMTVHVLDAAAARELAALRPQLTLPAEDVSYQVVERYFPRCGGPLRHRVPALGQAARGVAAATSAGPR